MIRLAMVLVLIVSATALSAESRKVIRADAEGSNLLKPEGFVQFGQGFTRDGDVFVCDNGGDVSAIRGVSQHLNLNQKLPLPILASAESRAENVGGSRDSDYSLYLDLTYMDGGHLWGQVGAFDTGTHNWQRRSVRIIPDRPVKTVSFHLLLRRHSGKAFFRNPRLSQVDLPAGATTFDGVPVSIGAALPGYSVRDVAADSDFTPVENGRALGLQLEAQTTQALYGAIQECTLTSPGEADRAITLVYSLPLPEGKWRWLIDPRRDEVAESPREYRSVSHHAATLSRYPLATVSDGRRGYAIALDMFRPAAFRVGFSAATRELFIAYDLGLTKERPSAQMRFCTFQFDSEWGFRSAVNSLYRIFPEQFRCRTPKQGIWMPFHRISQVEGWEDFGFAFKEGDNETAWDDQHGIVTFRYTEPMTWWMSMPKGMPRTMEAAVGEARRLADTGNASAKALLTSGFHDAAGQFVARLLDTPWCDGAVWSMNSSPGIPGETTDFKNKWNPRVKERLYGTGRKADLDGEYIDSSEGYVTDVYDFRRDHFAAMQTPLAFAPDANKPAAFRPLIAWEYIRGIERDIHAMKKLMMANGTPEGVCFLAPLLDVLGTETNWNPGGRWQPMSDSDLLYRRVLCGPKPYCFLMNTDFDRFPKELTEKFFKRSLAYGMFPGFFSANASTGHYFSRKELYNRDRPLFVKYIPLCRKVAEAGWQPITLARSSDPGVYVERFGRSYLTVFNDSRSEKEVTIRLDGLEPAGNKDLVSGGRIDWQAGKAKVRIAAEDVAVLEVK